MITGESEDTDIALSVAQTRKQIGRTGPDLNDPVVQEQFKQAYLRKRNYGEPFLIDRVYRAY